MSRPKGRKNNRIRPDKTQFLEAVYYTNMQPLTIEEHKKKTSRGRL